MSEERKILITGASGLVGSHIAHYFCRTEKNIYCLVRKESQVDFIKDLPVTLVYGDITDLTRLKELFEGMDWIIHTAAKVTDWGSYSDFYKTNVTGTLNVLKAALKNNIKDVIITGSVSSYGEEDSQVLKDETFSFRSHYPYAFDRDFPSGMNNYRDTKAESTRQAMTYAEQYGMNLTVIEPVWIYGENEFNSGFHEYLSIAKTGMPFMPGSCSNTFHVIYSRELARAYFLAFKRALAGIHRIIIGNEQADKMSDIYELFCKEAGFKKPRNLPKWIIYPVALALECLYLLLGITSPPLLTRSRVNMFYDSIAFNTKKAEELIGFTNRIDLETGIHRTVQWYLKNNRI